MLAPTRYRFRIVNSDGQDIRMAHSTFTSQSESSAESASSSTTEITFTAGATSTPETTAAAGTTPTPETIFTPETKSTARTTSTPKTTSTPDIKISSKSDVHYPFTHTDSTRVECGEPVAGYYYRSDKHYRYCAVRKANGLNLNLNDSSVFVTRVGCAFGFH